MKPSEFQGYPNYNLLGEYSNNCNFKNNGLQKQDDKRKTQK